MVALIRPASAEDDARVAVLVERMLGAQTNDPAGLLRFVAWVRGQGVLVVAEDDAGVCGFAGASASGDEYGVYLEPEARGLCAANALLDGLEAACGAAGAAGVLYCPSEDRARVAVLYARRGCVRSRGGWLKGLGDSVVV